MNKIYITDIKNIDNDTYTFFLSVLSTDIREKINLIKCERKRSEKVIGNILIRYAIKDFFGIPIKNQNFSYNQKGKPYITDYENVHFNLSNSGDMVVCAVGTDEIGVDIEKIRPIKEQVINKVCCSKELKYLENSTDKTSEFIRIWTAKEAYVKRSGEGLKGDLKKIPSNKAECLKFQNKYWISVSK